MEVDLRWQIALVVGSASAVGLAVADRLAASGATVVAADRDAGAAGNSRAGLFLALDPIQEGEAEAAVGRLLDTFGRLDILVNAGQSRDAPAVALAELPLAAWRHALDAHLTAAFLCARAAARPMLAQGYGRIVTIASAAGALPIRGHADFAVAQAGLIALTRAMALEWSGRGVLVSALAAGAIAGDEVAGDVDRRLLSHVPLGRPATLDEIADATLFLVDPENSYLTGHALAVDGGWTAGYARDF